MAEQENFDRKVRDKFKDQEMPLPVHLWENINKALPPQTPPATGASPWLWWIGSAVGIVLVFAVLYFVLSGSENKNASLTTLTIHSTAADQKNTVVNNKSNSSSQNTNRKMTNPGVENRGPLSVFSVQNENSASDHAALQGSYSSATSNTNTNSTITYGENTNRTIRNVTSVPGNSSSILNNKTSNAGGNSAGAENKGNHYSRNTSNSNNHSSPAIRNNAAGSAPGFVQQNTTQGNINTSTTSPANSKEESNSSPSAGGNARGTQTSTTSTTNSSDQNSGTTHTTTGVNGTNVTGPASAETNTAGSANSASVHTVIQNADTSDITNQNSLNSNNNQGRIAVIDSTKVSRDHISVNSAADNHTTSTTATTTTSGTTVSMDSNSPEQNVITSDSANAYNYDPVGSTASRMDTTNASVLTPVIARVDSAKTTKDSVLAFVDTTKQSNPAIPSDKKEKQNKNKDTRHLFSAEVYTGAGYGGYGIGLNPNATYTDSLQADFMRARFEQVTKTNHLTLSFGARVNYKVSEHFEVQAGMRYQRYSQTYAYDNKRLDSVYFAPSDTDYVNPLYHYTAFPHSGKEKTTFISVPIGVTYRHAINEKVSVYGRGELELRYMKSSGWNVKDTSGVVYASGKPSSSFNTGVYLAAGVQYKLTERLYFFAEPNTSFTIQNMYKKSDMVRQKPASVGLSVGLRMEF